MADEQADDNGIFPYAPSKIAALLFAGLFGISAIIHLVQMIKGRAWLYTSFVVGAISTFAVSITSTSSLIIPLYRLLCTSILTSRPVMAAGYAFRYISAKSPSELGPYIAQSLFIILPPSLYAATIYMIYGRLVLFVNATEASIIRPTRVTKIFVCGDIMAFFLQAGGGGMMAQSSMANTGQKVMLLGLCIQLLFFGFFVVISVIFYMRMRISPARFTVPIYGNYAWPALFKLLACAAVVIILRCTFRVIEFAQGHDGYLVSHEVFLYLFDTLPMFAVQSIFHFVRADEVFGTMAAKKLDGEIIGLYERA
jgi:hypothetical protein